MRKTPMFTAISAVLLLLARPVAAQDTPMFGFAAGYQYMHDSKSSADYPRGWMLSAGADVYSWFAPDIAGGVSASSIDLINLDIDYIKYLATI
jgi:hypothetical protein